MFGCELREMRTRKTGSRIQIALMVAALLATGGFCPVRAAEKAGSEKRLEITRAARSWEFLAAVGKRAGIFGNESGRVEAWAYPLKLFRDFHVIFRTEGRAIPAETLVRTVEAQPESTTLVYSGDTFAVRETFFVPVDEAGAVIQFEVETEQPLEIEVAFHRDFQLESGDEGVCIWGGDQEICGVCGIADGGRADAGVSNELFGVEREFAAAGAYGERQGHEILGDCSFGAGRRAGPANVRQIDLRL